MFKRHYNLAWLALVLVGWLAGGCSQQSNSLVSRSWHNLNAHYNAYFLAREKLKEVDKSVYAGHVENYNRVLDVYPPISTALEATLTPNLTEAVKKASLPIQRHKNSKWVDDCYLEIGKARYYKRDDYENGIHTFKYVNAKSKDVNLRHTALIWLMRIYTKGEEYNNAWIAADYLRKQKMIKPNRRDYHIARAYYHQSQKELDKMAANLEEGTRLMFWHNDRRARYHYIIGQVRQRQGKDSVAYEQFRQVVKNNPPYEMALYARLSMAQVTPASDAKKVARAHKAFKKMLRDPKNEEYRDRTYYEMGRFETKLGNYDKAVVNFKESVKQKGKNPNQVAYGYLALAELYYDRYKDFLNSSKYYDSCVAKLDTAEERYNAIVKRQKTLKEFVKQYEIVQREDSLLNMAAMAKQDSAALLAKIDKWIAADIAREKAAEKEARKAERRAAAAAAGAANTQGIFDNRTNLGFAPAGGAGGNSTWYFYNPTALSAGRQAWERKWGKERILEDNWRRKQKERDANAVAEQQDAAAAAAAAGKTGADSTKAQPGKKPGEGGEALASADASSPEADKEARRKTYLKDVPFTEKAQADAHEKLKPALYALGKIYEQQLDEPKNAEVAFLRIVNNYYDYEKTPEVMYFLYLMYERTGNSAQAQVFRDKLLKEFPDSKYAKLILNPNYLKESKQINEIVAQLYDQAYLDYELGRFVEAQSQLGSIRAQYPDNRYREKMRLLDIMIIGKTNVLDIYLDSLNRFIATTHPKSELMPFARDLQMNALAFKGKLNQPAGTAGKDSTAAGTSGPLAAAKPPTAYNTNVNAGQIVIMILPAQGFNVNNFQEKVALFNANYYPDEVFTVDNALLGDGKHLLVRVRDFRTKLQAMNYVKKMQLEHSPVKEKDAQDAGVKVAIITQENFPLLYRSKNVDEYLTFFKQHYDLSLLHGF